MHFSKVLPYSMVAIVSLGGVAGAATLTNGAGDGAVSIDTNEYGEFRNATFNPVGSVGSAETTFDSFVYFPTSDGPRQRMTDAATQTASVISETATNFVTSFAIDDLNITLTQSLSDSFDGTDRVGTVLSQQFVIENTGNTADFDLVRYFDGDLDFDGSIDDAGGRLSVGDNEILFETDSSTNGSNVDTFVGISRTVTGLTEAVESGRYEIDEYSDLRSRIQSGQDLNNTIANDADNDGFTDFAYDVTLAQQNNLRILENQTVVYTTNTLFGNAVPPAPGSLETLPLLPDEIGPEGGFVFNIDADDITEGEMIFIDPIIATGYTYEVTSAEFAGVQAPSLSAVPDGDASYTLTFNGMSVDLASGETYLFDDILNITSFTITGIDPALSLDPANTTAFVTGVSLRDLAGSVIGITQTPITFDTDAVTPVDPVAPVPLPASVLLLGGAVAGLGGLRRKKARS